MLRGASELFTNAMIPMIAINTIPIAKCSTFVKTKSFLTCFWWSNEELFWLSSFMGFKLTVSVDNPTTYTGIGSP
jgi:hypothetical protein